MTTISTPTTSNVTTGTVSASGTGSGLDVKGIVDSLMSVESTPKNRLIAKETSYTTVLSAYGTLSSSLSTFQTAIAGMSDISKFQVLSATPSDTTVLSATITAQASPTTHSINVTQLAQAQSIISAGQSSMTGAIGSGNTTTLTFQFGAISGGSYGSAALSGSSLSQAVATSGIPANSLSINGATISTGVTTTSAKSLASAINLRTGTTGVTATAQTTDTGALGNDFVTTTVDGYSLSVEGVSIISAGLAGVDRAAIDTALSNPTVAANLASAGVTVTGTAVAGDLHFTKADGSNISMSETLGAGDASGFFHSPGITKTNVTTSSVSLSSSNEITVAGTSPSLAGLNAGVIPNGIYTDASFTQNADQPLGTVTINNTNNSLQGIRDAINAADIGVTASIVSDSTDQPYHLVLTSKQTGEKSSMKISVSGDSDLANLLSYDPTSVSGQKMTQAMTAQNAQLKVNGISVNSSTNVVTESLQGVTLTLGKVGSTSLKVTRDTSAVESNVNAFVKAYNDVLGSLSKLTSYNIESKAAGALQGEATVRSIKVGIKSVLTKTVENLTGKYTSLEAIGVSMKKLDNGAYDGTLEVNSSKLSAAVLANFNDVAGLFATVGKTSDPLINYSGASLATKPGSASISISRLATQGKTVGSASADLVITSGVNDKLGITVDGVTTTVNLTAGTYSSASTLAAHVQSLINGSSSIATKTGGVTVKSDGAGVLTISSNRYGANSGVTVSQSAATALFGASPTVNSGVDVEGTINGKAASGSGQFLTAPSGSTLEGLKLQVVGGALGDRGTINYSQGYAFQFTKLVDSYVGAAGVVPARTKSLNSTIKDIKNQQSNWTARLASIERQYRKQFSALDTLIGGMKKTTSFLTQQLDLLASQTKANA